MQKKKGWALSGCYIAVACLCLGALYGFACGPTCWKCWSSGDQSSFFEQAEGNGLRLVAKEWFCGNCARHWSTGSPWVTHLNHNGKLFPPNPPADLEIGEIWYHKYSETRSGVVSATATAGGDTMEASKL